MATLTSLPFELLWPIYEQLDWMDRINCAKVSKEWRHVFNGLMNSSLTLDSPELYWSFIETYYQQPVPYVRYLTLVGIPVDLGLDIAIHHCSDLVSFTLCSLDPTDPMYGLLLADGDGNLDSPNNDTEQLNITNLFESHTSSLTFLTIDFPTNAMSTDIPTLLAALPPCLVTLRLSQITCPVNVLDLNVLYDTCHRLKKVSLFGQEFTKVDNTRIQSTTTVNGRSVPCSIVSLDLGFDRVDSVQQIMAFIGVVRSDRHIDLQHIGLHFTANELLTDDCPKWIYDSLVNQCSGLVSLCLKHNVLDGLMDAFKRRAINQGIFLRQLSISKEICMNGVFVNQFRGILAENIVSLTLLGTMQPRDDFTLLDRLALFGRLEHLDLECISPFIWPLCVQQRYRRHLPDLTGIQMHLPFTLFASPSAHRRIMWKDIRQVIDYARQNDIHLRGGHWLMRSDDGLYQGPHHYQWLLDPCAPSLTSLTLRQSSALYGNQVAWMSQRLQKLIIYKAVLDRSWASVLEAMDSLVEVHLDQCVSVHSIMLLDISRNLLLERLEISDMVMAGQRRYLHYVPWPLDRLSLYQVRSETDYDKTVFPIKPTRPTLQNLKGTLIVVCHPLKVLMVNQTKLLG